jgi:hypothetical protein
MIKFDELSGQVIGCAIEAPKTLDPGLLESAYKLCLVYGFCVRACLCKAKAFTSKL